MADNRNYPKPTHGDPRLVLPRPGQRPPGAPPLAPSAPRVPSLHDLVPPDVPLPHGQNVPPPPPEATPSREDKYVQIDNPSASADEVQLFTFERAWKACDVYVQPTQSLNTFQGFMRVKIYGTSQAGRALVASGIYTPNQADLNGRAVWVAGARAVCQRYEVTCQIFGNLTAPDKLVAAAVGSNEAVELPEQIGVSRLHNFPLDHSACMPGNFAASDRNAELEVVGVIATNMAAGTRSLQLHDRGTVAACVGQSPQYSFPMLQGQSINIRQNLGRFSRSGLVAFISSDPILGNAAGVAVGDVVYEVIGR